jgi:hypothetical protein
MWCWDGKLLNYAISGYRNNELSGVNTLHKTKLCSSSRDRLCGLVIRVLGYRSRVPGSIPGTTRKKVVGLERGPLILVRATEELFWSNSNSCGLESREYGRKDSSRWPRDTLYPQKELALASLTSGGRSVGIVRLRTKAMGFFSSSRTRCTVMFRCIVSILWVLIILWCGYMDCGVGLSPLGTSVEVPAKATELKIVLSYNIQTKCHKFCSLK